MQDLLVQLIGTIVAPASAIASPLAGKLIDQFGIHTAYIASVLDRGRPDPGKQALVRLRGTSK